MGCSGQVRHAAREEGMPLAACTVNAITGRNSNAAWLHVRILYAGQLGGESRFCPGQLSSDVSWRLQLQMNLYMVGIDSCRCAVFLSAQS